MRWILPLPLTSLLLASLVCGVPGDALALPPGFTRVPVPGTSFQQPVGLTFDANGRMYVWERSGKVWIIENGGQLPTPLIDLSDEVNNARDHGLLGFALHPNFTENGWIYLLYAVDHYYMTHAGTPGYDPNASEPFAASIGRITRYTARASDGFHSVDPASRRVLLGESFGSGCPLIGESHGVGSLLFGSDDTLIASCGDGGTALGPPDSGGPGGGAATEQALLDGIITPAEDVGAFRAQLITTLAGKILRLDPQSGDGVPGNPFFDPAAPRSARSRIFAMGQRNPFRVSIRPNTGSHDPAAANPGSLYVGNVGLNRFEEIDVVKTPGQNGGWPVFEGLDLSPEFSPLRIENETAPNPLYNGTSCQIPFFSFGDLIVQETLGTPSWPNPCNPAVQIPASIPRFVNRRAGLTYGHDPSGPLLTPTFTGNTATSALVGAPGSPVSGDQFGGFVVTGSVWYEGTDFPADYQNSFFVSEFATPVLVNVHYDANDRPVSVKIFDNQLVSGIISMATSPTTGGLYALELYTTSLYRIAYQGSGNLPPVAQATVAPVFGATPFGVQFDGTASSDPENQALAYSWSFGDGSAPSTLANPIHFYFGPVGVPTTYTATLTVRDPQNQTSTAQVRVFVNDTPPSVTIQSPVNQGFYAMTGPTTVPLSALISDAEHGPSQLSCAWQVSLHHNTHFHPAPVDTNCTSSAVLDPAGCDGNDYSYSFDLTVTDAAGLATTRGVALYPDCASIFPAICGNLDANAFRNVSDMVRLRLAFANPVTNGLSPGELSRCSMIGGAECNIADLTVLRRYLKGKAPGPMPVCPAAQP
jgi:glucose/arabinose dehydrogenase